MHIRKTLLAAAAGAAMLVAAPAANAYVGGWYSHNNPGGWEILGLGDNTDGTFLQLRGTSDWCGQPGSSYAAMRSVLSGRSQVTWWIDYECNGGDYVRVCIRGNGTRCSTYWNDGWQ